MDGATTAEGDYAFRVIRRLVTLDWIGREIVLPPLAVSHRLVRAVVLARADGETVLCRPRRRDRIQIDPPVGVSVSAFVSGGEADQHVAMLVSKLVDFVRLLIVNAEVPWRAPRVSVNPGLVGFIRALEQVIQIIG